MGEAVALHEKLVTFCYDIDKIILWKAFFAGVEIVMSKCLLIIVGFIACTLSCRHNPASYGSSTEQIYSDIAAHFPTNPRTQLAMVCRGINDPEIPYIVLTERYQKYALAFRAKKDQTSVPLTLRSSEIKSNFLTLTISRLNRDDSYTLNIDLKKAAPSDVELPSDAYSEGMLANGQIYDGVLTLDEWSQDSSAGKKTMTIYVRCSSNKR